MKKDLPHISDLTKEAVQIRRKHFQHDEVTIEYVKPALFDFLSNFSFQDSFNSAADKYLNDNMRLLEIGRIIDMEVAEAYGVKDFNLLDEEICPFPLSYPNTNQNTDSRANPH